jgi:hypothetical protein
MTMATARMALGVGTLTITGDRASRLISIVFGTPEGQTIPVVLSTVEIKAVASILETMDEPGLTEGALRTSIIAAIGRDPFDE